MKERILLFVRVKNKNYPNINKYTKLPRNSTLKLSATINYSEVCNPSSFFFYYHHSVYSFICKTQYTKNF